MNKISFIIEFDEVSKTQEEQLTEFIEKTGIKFHVLENDNNNLKIHYEIKPSFTTRKIKELQQERDLYKEVIKEVREYIEKYRYITDKVTDEDSLYYGQDITIYAFNDDNVMELLQILDKVIGDNK